MSLTWGQKARRLWQPKSPVFWVMMAVNALNSVLVWLSQTQPLSPGARWLVLGFAVGNLWVGLLCARQLINTPVRSNAKADEPI
jgi:hypothetical protein